MMKGRWKGKKSSSQVRNLCAFGDKAAGAGSLGTRRFPGRGASLSRIWKRSRWRVEELSLETERGVSWRTSQKHPWGCAPRTPWCVCALPLLSLRAASLGWATLKGVMGGWGRRSLWCIPAGSKPGGAVWDMQAGSAPRAAPRPPIRGLNHTVIKRVLIMNAAVPEQASTEKKGCHSNYLGCLSGNLQLFATLRRCWE